ncbi:MAG: plasmid maintenance system antidote protein [Rhodoglobus sp.]|nr:plasmid maintenance system antidote protein [Rhodoglobus sp.]
MNPTIAFAPRWASAPGETIVEALQRRNHTVDDLADALGVSDPIARALVTGAIELTEPFAAALARLTGSSADFWLRRERNYRDSLRWLSFDEYAQQVPFEKGEELGWVERAPHHWRERAQQFVEFFEVESIDDWRVRYGDSSALRRASGAFDTDIPAQALWLRQAEREADSINIGAWSKAGLSEAVRNARHLSRLPDPERFVPQLKKMLADVGVALVVLPTPPRVPVSGAARRRRDNRPLIALSGRYLTDDHFWFTLFHEIGHVLRHELESGFVDDLEHQEEGGLESEANDFARRTLLPSGLDELRGRRLIYKDVIAFAAAAGIAPGVVVGQLQHDGILERNQLNQAKRRYRWAAGQLVLSRHSQRGS